MTNDPRKNNSDIIGLLSESRTDFEFDRNGVKQRLINSIHRQKFEMVPEKNSPVKSWAFRLGVGICVLILAAFTGALSFAQASKPGDKLHFLDKIEDNAMLSLPLPQGTKAKIQSNIATERVKEMSNLPLVGPDSKQTYSIKLKAADESQRVLVNAVNTAQQMQARSETKGDAKASAKAKKILTNLEQLATEQEAQLNAIHSATDDEQVKERVEKSLEAIKQARKQAHEAAKETKNRSEDLSEPENE
ncbi:MAG: hypothetical protein ACM3KM_01745 [Acidobacteriaceae bacterium]